MVLASFWDCFRTIVGSVRDRLGCVRVVFGHTLRMFWYGFGIVFIWFLGALSSMLGLCLVFQGFV